MKRIRNRRKRHARKRLLEASAFREGAQEWVLRLRIERNHRPLRGVTVHAGRDSSLKAQLSHAQRAVDVSTGTRASRAAAATGSYHSRGVSRHGTREIAVSSRGRHNSAEVEAI